MAQLVKNVPAMRETWVLSLGWENPLEKGKVHSNLLAWRIPWTVQSMGAQRVGHDRVTFTQSLHVLCESLSLLRGDTTEALQHGARTVI